ncbi:restriction endonuclease subunit S [Endozoicomonas acroporae]|uniref:restriction endonuclease subunit S n=1 Tax=Endozoicomonas acroporae TaxID=1701104 RepID=UPI000C77E3F9|nr:restriction endonuclease subunit S [Endozoicomonas acroporae]
MVPEDWVVKPISTITRWSSGGTPSKNKPEYWNGSIPWISAASMRGMYYSDSELKITDQAACVAKMAEPNTLLLLVRGSTLWNRIPVGITTQQVAFNQDVKCIEPIMPFITPEFLLNWFLAHEHQLLNMVTGTGIGAGKLETSDLQQLEIYLPPLPEQKKIARILSSVDSKLALIDQQITTTQTLKKGLMQKLFTQGVGTQDIDGRWQPHTEFQESELGRIPTGWAVTKLDELVTRGSGHTPDKQHPEYWNGGIKWISLADSSRLDKGIISTTDKEISYLGIDNSSAVLHPKGTVVMSRDAGIGKSALMGEDMAVSQHFIAWSCEQKGKLNNWFLYYLLQLMKPEFERIAIGSTIKTIGLPYFKKLKIAHPIEIAEQNEIARILSTVDRKLGHLQTQKTQTQQLKKGLMQKLLTGQIRVQPDPQDN